MHRARVVVGWGSVHVTGGQVTDSDLQAFCSIPTSPPFVLLAPERGVLVSPAGIGDLSISLPVCQLLCPVFKVLLVCKIVTSS